MDRLGDVLRHRNMPVEPPEVRVITAFVRHKYDEAVQVVANDSHIRIVVPHAALAGALRFDVPELRLLCHTTKKIYIRIGAS